MPIEALTETIAQTTTIISGIAVGLFALTWTIASLLRGSVIPFRSIKEHGQSMQQDAVYSTFMLALWSSITALITWVVNVLASAA